MVKGANVHGGFSICYPSSIDLKRFTRCTMLSQAINPSTIRVSHKRNNTGNMHIQHTLNNENLTRMPSSRMRTARLLTICCRGWGGSIPAPWMQTSLWMQTSPGCRLPWMQTPPGHVSCDACWEAIPIPTEGMTLACENITLLQTSFTGGNNIQELPYNTRF